MTTGALWVVAFGLGLFGAALLLTVLQLTGIVRIVVPVAPLARQARAAR